MRSLDYAVLTQNIIQWIKDYIHSAGAEGVVVGLSGGIDSSVTAALCTKALGKRNIIGLNLPCESFERDEDPNLMSKVLDIQYHKFDLTPTYKDLIKLVESEITTNKLAKGNIKPRLRMSVLYLIAQSKGSYLVAGTGNRTEIAIGYFTKYGDGGVDFEPIGDLYKYEVREIAKLLEIPHQIIEKPPSAGLWKGQTDEAEIGLSYEMLDEIIYHIDYNLDLKGFREEDIRKVQKMMKKSQHKQRMPPLFRVDKI
ncbi:MAG: NAD+ synthase [Candidatus Lokiarchaeota archaeon]|nr:NAD+ synthase [Candidatus Lokiarchaeota archaeon]MBD3198457.1 NAD+ synthase [Candidatus Lokiarchaeota archaeon]